MGLLLLLGLLCASGCDRLLGLGNIAQLSDGGALDDGLGGDGGGGDAGPTICKPSTTTFGTSYGTLVSEAAVSELAGFEIYQYAGNLLYDSPIGGGTPTVIATGSHPALSRDGSELFVDATGGVVEYMRSNNFAASTPVSALGSAYPGTPVTLASGDTAMVVSTGGTGFQEWRRPSGSSTWSAFGPVFDPEAAGVGVDYPSLGADGMILVYVATSKFTRPTVKFIRRARQDTDFTFLATSATALLVNSNYLASPWISDDCKHLYVVAGVDIGMNYLTQYTLQ